MRAFASAFRGVLPLVLFVSTARAQEAEQQATAIRQHSVAVLGALRKDDLESALESLGAAADLAPGIHPHENDGLAAAGGGIYRALMQLSSDEQFDLLYAWSLPSESRRSVRLLTTLTPREVPPQAFARALGERPRDSSFPVAEIGGLRGLFSTGWRLVQVADEIGRLRRLTTELEQLAEQKLPNADVLLLLARIADRRGETSAVAENLQRRASALQARLAEPTDGSLSIDSADVVLAAAALSHEELRPLSEQIFRLLADSTNVSAAPRLRPLLRVAHATATQLHHGVSGPESLYRQRLKHWVAVSGMTADLHSAGAVEAMWLVHEDHILHLAGAGNDVLFLRYPLTGDFDFTCETQEGGAIGTDGGLVYGGLQFEALGSPEQLTVWDASLLHAVRRPCPFVRHEDRPTFNRASLRSSDTSAVFAANLHPMWSDGAAAQSSPWLGLRSFGDRRPIFRNLKITGSPVIPREVRLAEGNQLRGWQAHFFSETLPAFTAEQRQPETNDNPTTSEGGAGAIPTDWTIRDGVIEAAKHEAPRSTGSQSVLRYQRPLLESESVTYEFHYEPAKFEVHPALGRLAFVLDPSGVRIHWITDGPLEWTTLSEDNETLEPLYRRGPRPLPLRESAWNQVTLARAEGKVTVTLNGELIYERPIDFGGDLSFGLYRDPTKSAVRVRQVVMTGDWPETLPADFVENPAAVVDEPQASADSRVLNDTVGSVAISDNVRQVRRAAASLLPAERFEYLARWVLPGPTHSDFRVTGEFTPTDPSPLAVELEGVRFASSERGGEVVSPVFDLLDVATEVGRLEELRASIANIAEPRGEYQRRAQAALSMLVHLESGDEEGTIAAAETLYQLAMAATPTHEADMWPETLAVHRALPHAKRILAIGELLGGLYSQRTSRAIPEFCENWHARITYLTERYRHASEDIAEDRQQPEVNLEDWISVQRLSSRPRGYGYPQTRWYRNDQGEIHHLSGHHEDYLFFRSPLRGAFEVAGDMGIDATTQLYVAGKYFGPRWILDEFETGTFRDGGTLETLDPPFGRLLPWVRFRAVIGDQWRRISINGRPVHTEQLDELHDPWIGFRAWSRAVAKLRHVQFVGTPGIPDAVLMSASKELIGWVPYYYEPTGHEGAIWRHVEAPDSHGEIHARRRPELAHSFYESMLGYHRPLVEDGAIEYEFFYKPGKIDAHPALDRLVFMLAPNGVRIHWLTDEKFDRTAVPPDNLVDEPQHRRGSAELPLKPGAWNHVRLEITGNLVTLELNGQPIYERPLESNNRRTFGLFHYADQTELRVRNVVMKGEWPKTLPQPSGQELADDAAIALDLDLPRLKSVFVHDFAQDGLPDRYFKIRNSNGTGQTHPRPDGLLVVRPGPGEWLSLVLSLPFSAIGDFDFEASFDQLKLEADTHAAILLHAGIDDERQHHCRLVRIRHRDNFQEIDPSLSILHPTGHRSYSNDPMATEALSGTLRVARRKAQVHYLFAESDSDVFQLVGTHDLTDKPLMSEGVELVTLCNGAGETQVLWKSITLRAEQLMYLPPDAQPAPYRLHVMHEDGSNRRVITGPAPGFTHLGSPEWSADGRKIAMDMSRGSVATSRIVVIDVEDGRLKDIGAGCMPSFSPDAQRIVFSQPGQGILIMQADGSQREVVDSSGWGVQWSPDGRHIAYGKGGNVVIMNPQTRKQRLLLSGAPSSRYSSIYWNLGWSPDNRWIAFKGHNRQTGEFELAVADVESRDEFQVLYATAGSLNADFTWSPDSRRVVFSMESPLAEGPKLFWVDRTEPEAPQLLAGQPKELRIFDCDWSTDGSRIAFSGQAPVQAVAWSLSAATP